MKKALRMVHNSYYSDYEFEKNYDTISKNIDVVDEITFFTEPTHHGYIPLNEVIETAAILKKRIKAFKDLGVPRVGINILCTIGHTEEGSDCAEQGDLRYVTNRDGRVSKSCPCITNAKYLEYIREKYTIYSGIGADFIWLDDDVRIPIHGVLVDYCFCPDCLEKFNKRNGTSYDIEYVRSNWTTDEDLRAKWHDSASDSLNILVKLIRKTIEETDPKADIGFMNGSLNLDKQIIANSGAVLGRPGGGYCNDESPKLLFYKMFHMQEVIDSYNDNIKDIQYEYETYNFRSLEKSDYMSELETTASIMAGCNGILYNRWDWERAHGFYEMLRRSTKKWNLLSDLNTGCKNTGVYCPSTMGGFRLSELGIPATCHFDNAVASYICGTEWNDFDNTKIEKILQKGVLTDGLGLKILNERGFEKYTGGKIRKVYKTGVTEYFTDHPFNGEYKNSARHISMDIYNEGNAYAFDCENCEILSHANFMLKEAVPSMYIYESEMGTRIAVDGCQYRGQMQTGAKQTQLMNLFAYLTCDKMPIRFDKSVKVISAVMCDKSGGMTVMLANASFDATGKIDFTLDTDRDIYVLTEDGSLIPSSTTFNGGKMTVHVENIQGWGYILLTNKNLFL